jgi:hypothetical protein
LNPGLGAQMSAINGLSSGTAQRQGCSRLETQVGTVVRVGPSAHGMAACHDKMALRLGTVRPWSAGSYADTIACNIKSKEL